MEPSYDPRDSTDKDTPDGIVISYGFRISEQILSSLTYEEFMGWLDRKSIEMIAALKEKASDHWIDRQTDKDFPTEFTRP